MKKGLSVLPKKWIKKYVFRPPNPAAYIFELRGGKYHFVHIQKGKRKEVVNTQLTINAHILKGNNLYVPLIHLQLNQQTRTEESVSLEQFAQSKSMQFQKDPERNKQLVIFSHGNASDLGDVYFYGERLCYEYGFDFIAYDYTGYGLGLGRQCSEQQTYNDLQAVLAFAVYNLKYDITQIILWGFSLGSGPATEIASRYSGLVGLVLQAPLASIYNWFGEGEYGNQDMYKNVNKIASVRVPILILHGDADDVVECWHSLTLYEKYCKVNGMNGKICYMSVSGRGHNDLQFAIENGDGDIGLWIHRFTAQLGTSDERELKLLELCQVSEYLPSEHFYSNNVLGKGVTRQEDVKRSMLSLCSCD